jgi:predicted O-methyltransferase YrrM
MEKMNINNKIKNMFINSKNVINTDNYRNIEIQKYPDCGFDYENGVQYLNQILTELNITKYSDNTSVHWLLFSCISQLNLKIENILEIGTYLGETTSLLASLFKNAKITTVDLQDEDPMFVNSYSRDTLEYFNNFIKTRGSNLNNANIQFLQTNSFFLPGLLSNKYDLIWVDGDHLLPTVAWDICNAYHLCADNGWLIFDDIILDSNWKKQNKYGSDDSSKILKWLEDSSPIDFCYFLKRIKPSYLDPRNIKKKYIALGRKYTKE